MTITNSFKEAVSSGNVIGIRIMMKDSLLVDPTFAEFNEMSRLASKVRGLYDIHDGRELQSDISTWNDDYMNRLMVQVVDNFSKERLDHLKAVVKHLRPVTTRSQPQSTASRPSSSASGQMEKHSKPRAQQAQHNSYQYQRRQDLRSSSRGVKIAAGAVIGGAVGGTIAGVAGGSVIVGAAVGAVLVGAAVVIVTNGE